MTIKLPYEEVVTGSSPAAAVIWLHGLGANGHDFVPVAQQLQLPKSVRFIFPHAPSIPVTINSGAIMPAWYDILSMSIERKIDMPQIMNSAAAIQQLIQAEIDKGIAPEHIIIAGFSQGGAVAYQAALSFPKKLGGLLAMSTYFATAPKLKLAPANATLPILIQHGLQDPMVPEELGQRALKHLQALKLEPKYLTYNMEHAVCPDQLFDINQWLNERLT